ncbi:MAG: OmpA family protein [Rhodobacterales bacterium]|nr:OmpA family protein [Rhodobacterales bacterium]
MIVFLALLFGAQASAQDVENISPYPIDIERFRPYSDTYGYAITESATTLYNLQVGVSMWGNYSEDAAVLVFNGDRVIGEGPDFPDGMVDQRTVVNFQSGIGIADVFSFTFDLPVVAWQQGFEPTAAGSSTAITELTSAGLGDLRLTPKVVMADIHDGYPIGIAFLTRLSLPTGSSRSFIGEGDVTFEPLFAIEAADGSIHDRDYQFRTAINVGARIKPADQFRDTSFGPEFVFRYAMAVRPADQVELGADIGGAVSGSRVAQFPFEVLPWLKIFPQEWVQLTVGAGLGLNPGLGAPDVRGFLGGTVSPSFDPLALDRDQDGIPNKFDECINIPEDLDGFEDTDGCPDDDNDQDGILDVNDGCPNDPADYDNFQDQDGCPDEDNDQDGILDLYDSCPMDPEDRDGWQDTDGCPDPDNDADGYPDVSDACPNAAETFNGFEDTDGCPDDKPHVDSDGDGYIDEADGCPFDPEDFDGFQDDDGCPEPDNDLDGIFDVSDQCPMDPETANGYLDQDGCPDVAPSRVVVEKSKIKIADKIFFETGKAVIEQVSFELLDEIAGVINDHPHITRIRIEGHTDSDGGDSYNQRLSQSRAEAVVEYMVKEGVERSRLEGVGYGEALPIDTNKTRQGKAKNRRVEFTILEKDE